MLQYDINPFYNALKKIRIFLLIVACIVLFVGLIRSCVANIGRQHNPVDIEVVLLQTKSQETDDAYNILCTYRITNNTGATIKNIVADTIIKYKNGNDLGSIRAKWWSDLHLNPGESRQVEIYLTYRKKDMFPADDLFVELYNNGLGNVFASSYKIQYVSWEDGQLFKEDNYIISS